MTNQRPPLGAALYVPAVHPDLGAILRREKLQHVKEIIICTEDAVAEHELPLAMENLKNALMENTGRNRICFLRPRNLEIYQQIMNFSGAEKSFWGVVLPKFTHQSFKEWDNILPTKQDFWIMPTLETVDVFNYRAMTTLAQRLTNSKRAEQILTLRIGGNDLLALLKMRRPRGTTLYETPLGKVIANLVTIFIPYGLPLSAPVFEYLDDPATLAREIIADLNHGLTGKTAIHPDQVPWIESHYMVQACELQMAKAILNPNAKGVFRLNGIMCEPATHRPWAEKILSAAKAFGTIDDF